MRRKDKQLLVNVNSLILVLQVVLDLTAHVTLDFNSILYCVSFFTLNLSYTSSKDHNYTFLSWNMLSQQESGEWQGLVKPQILGHTANIWTRPPPTPKRRDVTPWRTYHYIIRPGAYSVRGHLFPHVNTTWSIFSIKVLSPTVFVNETSMCWIHAFYMGDVPRWPESIVRDPTYLNK